MVEIEFIDMSGVNKKTEQPVPTVDIYRLMALVPKIFALFSSYFQFISLYPLSLSFHVLGAN